MHHISDSLYDQLELLSRYANRHLERWTTASGEELCGMAMQLHELFLRERLQMPHICDECSLDVTAELHSPWCSMNPEPPEHDGEPDAGMVERSRGVLPR